MDVLQTDVIVPSSLLLNPVKFYECIEALFECANSSWICADASLHEADRSDFTNCIEICLIAAETCAATARILAREEEYPYETTRHQLARCMEACSKAAAECRKYADLHEHCLINAQCAEECAKSCLKVLESLQK